MTLRNGRGVASMAALGSRHHRRLRLANINQGTLGGRDETIVGLQLVDSGPALLADDRSQINGGRQHLRAYRVIEYEWH